MFTVLPPIELSSNRADPTAARVVKVGEKGCFSCDEGFLGEPVKYGDQIVMLNEMSGSVLAPNYEVGGRGVTSREVRLNSELAQTVNLCSFVPFDNRTRHGDDVDLSKPFLLAFIDESNTEYFLAHNCEDGSSVFVSLQESIWSATIYSAYQRDEKTLLQYGRIVAIRSKKTNAVLTAVPINEEEITFLPDVDVQSKEIRNGGDDDLPSALQCSYRISLTFEEQDCNAYWIFERKDQFEGGQVTKGELFWLKHAATQRYLSPSGQLTLEKSSENCFLIPQSHKRQPDDKSKEAVALCETLQLITANDEVLVTIRDQSKSYVWSALFESLLLHSGKQAKELCFPVAFRKSGARRYDGDFEVSAVEDYLCERLLLGLCLRPNFRKFRLFHRRLEALATAWISLSDDEELRREVADLHLFYDMFIVILATEQRIDEFQSILYAIGYHHELIEGLFTRRIKTNLNDCRSLKLEENVRQDAKQRISRLHPEILDRLAGIQNLFSLEIAPLLLSNNPFVCQHLIENPQFLPVLVHEDPVLVADILGFAVKYWTPSLSLLCEYANCYNSLMLKSTQRSELAPKVFKLLAALCRKSTKSFSINPQAWLYTTTESGAKVPIITFSGQSEAPSLSLFDTIISFLPRRRLTPSFIEGLKTAESCVDFLISVCKATRSGLKQLSEDMKLTPEFLKACIRNPSLNEALQVRLESLYLHLYIDEGNRAETVSAKMKSLCFSDQQINSIENRPTTPLETDCSDLIVREAITAELAFWVSSQPSDFLLRCISSPDNPGIRAILIFAHIQNRIVSTAKLIERQSVNSLFVCAIKVSLTALLKSFVCFSERSKEVSHWSGVTLGNVLNWDYQLRIESGSKQPLVVSEADVKLTARKTWNRAVKLYQLILDWEGLVNIQRNLPHYADWTEELRNEKRRSEIQASFVSANSPENQRELVRFLQSSDIKVDIALFEHAERHLDIQEILTTYQRNTDISHQTPSKLISKIMKSVSDPISIFTDYLQRTVLLSSSAYNRIGDAFSEFTSFQLDMKSLIQKDDPNSLLVLRPIITALVNLCNILDFKENSSEDSEQQVRIAANSPVIIQLLKDLWGLSEFLDQQKLSDADMTINLKTLVLIASRLYARRSQKGKKSMIKLMKCSSFFSDCPEYIQLLGDFRVLREAPSDTIYLLVDFLVTQMRENPLRINRISDCFPLIYTEDGDVINRNMEITALVIYPALEAALASASRNPIEIAVYFRILTDLIAHSPPLKSNLQASITIAKLQTASLFVDPPFDLLLTVLELTEVMDWSGEIIETAVESIAKFLSRGIEGEEPELEEISLLWERNDSVDANCVRNANRTQKESGSIARFLYSVDRNGVAHGFLVRAISLIFDIGRYSKAVPEDGLLQIVGYLSSFYTRLKQIEAEKSKVAPLVSVLLQALKEIRRKVRNLSSVRALDDQKATEMISALRSIPEES